MGRTYLAETAVQQYVDSFLGADDSVVGLVIGQVTVIASRHHHHDPRLRTQANASMSASLATCFITYTYYLHSESASSSSVGSPVGPRVFCGLADLRTCGPTNAVSLKHDGTDGPDGTDGTAIQSVSPVPSASVAGPSVPSFSNSRSN